MIRRQVVVPVSPERLWEALTDPDQVADWFGGRVEWDLREGGKASFRGDDGTTRVGRIEAIRPGRHLRFRWWPAAPAGAKPDKGPAGRASEPEDTPESEVSYLLEPLDDGTRLTIQERPVPQPVWPGPRACAVRGTQIPDAQPSATGTAEGARSWTRWDGRLASAWAGLVRTPVRS